MFLFEYGVWIVLVVTILGLILKLAGSPKAAEIGTVMFSWGLLVFLLCICGVTTKGLHR